MTRDVTTRKAAGKALDRQGITVHKRSTACCTCLLWQRKPSW
ncbi:Phosphoribosylformylglycinamidine synthase,synthetase subunit / Phosphoribosylformylglycinamidine synthase, glutamine amidotransferase subunit [Enterobacter hormaechei]|nr:Phosphoribosylformylglycinamidine synthase,synthetase subunit / Phosphoribosylformylglycinamidine synthase, glutamine amidotransferase subunit [Enterobacter hormaechei]